MTSGEFAANGTDELTRSLMSCGSPLAFVVLNARNDTRVDESLVNLSDPSFFDDLPRREPVKVWWIRLVEPPRFADQVSR